MTTYKAIIVDDEKRQQDLLAKRLEDYFPEIELVSRCYSVDEGILAVVKHEPELVFLDVEMPEKDGFDFLASFKSIQFSVIFTTSHADYAMRAFRVSALDYLLKPFSVEQLREAIDKFKAKHNLNLDKVLLKNLTENRNTHYTLEQKVALPTSQGYSFVRFGDIMRIEALTNGALFFLISKDQIIVSRGMKECEDLLPSNYFVRVHKSHIVNIHHVKRYNKGDGGTLVMDDGVSVEVSRRKKDEFLEAFNKL